ncbi:MAG: TauD/TfdA family dioxygenase, partial [Pseudomonadota bacterium]
AIDSNIAHTAAIEFLDEIAKVLGDVIKIGVGGPPAELRRFDDISEDLGDLVEEFDRRGVRYVRVYRDHIDIPLAKAFGTDDLKVAEERARAKGMDVDFASDGSMRSAHTVRGAVGDAAQGKKLHFNQAHMFHASRLRPQDREGMVQLFGEDGLPRQALWGDGEQIPDETIDRVVEVLRKHTQVIEWTDDDVVLIDNLRFLHGRQTFDGERKVTVAMGANQDLSERTALSL